MLLKALRIPIAIGIAEETQSFTEVLFILQLIWLGNVGHEPPKVQFLHRG